MVEDAQRQPAHLKSLQEEAGQARTLVEYLHLHPVPTEDSEADLEPSPRLPSLQMEEELAQRFWCRRKLRMIGLDKCLDDFVDHTALSIQQSNCTECPQGAWNRRCFARS